MRQSLKLAPSQEIRVILVSVMLVAFVVLADVGRIEDARVLVIGPPNIQALTLTCIAAVSCALWRRRRPQIFFTVALVCVLVVTVLRFGGGGCALAFTFATYAVVRYSSTWPNRILVIIGVSLTVGAQVLVNGGAWFTFGPTASILAALIAVGFGAAGRARAAELKALRDQAASAEQAKETLAHARVMEDRLDVARELHDVVAHRIAVINVKSSVAARAIKSRPTDAAAVVGEIGVAARDIISDISSFLTRLRTDGEIGPAVLYEPGVTELVERFRSSGLQVQAELGALESVAPRSFSVIYLVLQEALTNAYKHGDHGTPVRVRVEGPREGRVVVEVVNGLKTATAPAPGQGLRGAQERISAAGGSLDIKVEEHSFTFRAMLPTNGAAL